MKGKLTISRMHSNRPDEDDIIRIRLEDELSGIEFVQIGMTPEALALALTGLSLQECNFELHGLQNIGKRREHKTEIVPFPGDVYDMTDEAKRQALAPFEIDDWRGNDRDLGNHHKQVKNSIERAYYVTFTRFVEAEPDDNPT